MTSGFDGHVGKQIEGYEDVHVGNEIEETNVEGKTMLLEFCETKEGKGNRKYLRDVKVILGELQHRLVVTDLFKKKVVKKEAIERSPEGLEVEGREYKGKI